jgi:hypothetical protein
MNKIGFIIPTTSNDRDWTDFKDTYLNRIIGKTIPKTYNIKLFVGYDNDDKLYSIPEQRVDNIDNILIQWIGFDNDYKGNPCSIWNKLGNEAVKQGYEYIMVLGDDISMPTDEVWLDIFINKLKENNNVGYSAGFSNNDEIPTQFLLHKTHLDIFGFIFPSQIRNWYCDNYIYDLYGDKFGNWLKEYHLLNVGGSPRYKPDHCENLKNILVKKNRKILFKYLNKHKYLD